MVKIVVLQYESREDDLLNQFMEKNKNFSEKNDLEYIRINKSHFDYPPYWIKIFEMDKILSSNHLFDYLIWVDSDAFFLDSNKEKLINLIEKNPDHSLFISKDMPPWYGEFNAGVFMVKNSDRGKAIMKRWISFYDEKRWEYKDGKWQSLGPWAGDDYEQGSFIKHILNDEEYKKDILQLPYYLFNNNGCESNLDESISAHLAAEYKQNSAIVDKCRDFITNITESFSNHIEHYISSPSSSPSNLSFTFILVIFLFILFSFIFIKRSFPLK